MRTAIARTVFGLLFIGIAASAACSSPSDGGSETNWQHIDGGRDASFRASGDASGDAGGGAGASDAGGNGHPATGQYEQKTRTSGTLTWPGAESNGYIYGMCTALELSRDPAGKIPCFVSRSVPLGDAGCDCSSIPGLTDPSRLALAARRDNGECDVPGKPACDDLCTCELKELGADCHDSAPLAFAPETEGFCYVDPAQGGNPTIVEKCPPTERHMVRFGKVEPGAVYGVICDATTHGVAATTLANPGGLGRPCTPDVEQSPNFGGFSSQEVAVEQGSLQCGSGLCIVDHFAGRTNCPYGQLADATTGALDPSIPLSERCYTAGPDATLVTVPVIPQKEIRPASAAVYCSCQCDGAVKGATYCACPSGFECTPLLPNDGLMSGIGGSYCTRIASRPPPDWENSNDCLLPAVPRPQGGCLP